MADFDAADATVVLLMLTCSAAVADCGAAVADCGAAVDGVVLQ